MYMYDITLYTITWCQAVCSHTSDRQPIKAECVQGVLMGHVYLARVHAQATTSVPSK